MAMALTVAGGERVAPPVVFLTHQWFFVAQPVAWVAAEWHRGADGEVLAVAQAIHRDARVEAGIGVHSDAWVEKQI